VGKRMLLSRGKGNYKSFCLLFAFDFVVQIINTEEREREREKDDDDTGLLCLCLIFEIVIVCYYVYSVLC
jgi:hypothetical protein